MLKYGNRDFRSLQEQVYANMRNIEDIIKGQDIIADYTLQIVGQVDTAAELPDADTYEGKLGDIYVVGTESPFDGYAFVKVYENENAPSWVDLGPILVQGPQGEQGPQGIQGIQGPQGDQGVPAGFGVPTASIQGTTGTPNVSITASGPNTARVFDFTFYNLKGETGAQGPAGQDGRDGVGVPEIEAGDAGKALMVNAGETAAEWTELPSGLPEIEAGDAGKLLAVNSAETGAEWVEDSSLKLPESAPAAQQLVGVNTSGVQNALGIGYNLLIDQNNINSYELYELTLAYAVSSANNKTIEIPSNIATLMKNGSIKYVIIRFNTIDRRNSFAICGLYKDQTSYDAWYEGYTITTDNASEGNVPGISNYRTSYQIELHLSNTTLTVLATQVKAVTTFNPNISVNESGTLASADFNKIRNQSCWATWQRTQGGEGAYVYFTRFYYCYRDDINHKLYMRNIACSAEPQYELEINTSTRAYTITQITN